MIDLVIQRVGDVMLPTWVRVEDDEDFFHQLHDSECGCSQFHNGRCLDCGSHFEYDDDGEFTGYLPIELCAGADK